MRSGRPCDVLGERGQGSRPLRLTQGEYSRLRGVREKANGYIADGQTKGYLWEVIPDRCFLRLKGRYSEHFFGEVR